MLFPAKKATAVTLFHFINQLYEKKSFIITTNKKPAKWPEILGDEVIATVLLDRLLYRCEIINLSGKSYRIQNRKTIFSDLFLLVLHSMLPKTLYYYCRFFGNFLIANFSALLVPYYSLLFSLLKSVTSTIQTP